MPTRYGRSPWIDRFPKSRVPAYPKYRGSLAVDAVIIGGGLTGCATAYAFASAGVKVALFEAGRLGQGTSGSSNGWISDEPGLSFTEVEKAVGVRAARHGWQAWRRAALDSVALLRRLDITCDLVSRTRLVVAATPEQAAALGREQKARRAAGIDVSALTTRAIAAESGVVASSGIRSREGATIDPYRAIVGLAAAAAERGALIFEQSPITKITFNRKDAGVVTEGGAFRVGRVIVATAMPKRPLFGSLVRHFWFKSSYLVLTEPVPAKIRNALGTREGVVRDMATPPHVIRWVDDDRLLIEGADGDATPERLREKTIIQRTGQLMYELSTIYPDISGIMPAYGWDAPYALTGEGLPYVGAHRNFPHHLFAFGDSSHGVTGSFLASRILLRQHLGGAQAADAAFGFNR